MSCDRPDAGRAGRVASPGTGDCKRVLPEESLLRSPLGSCSRPAQTPFEGFPGPMVTRPSSETASGDDAVPPRRERRRALQPATAEVRRWPEWVPIVDQRIMERRGSLEADATLRAAVAFPVQRCPRHGASDARGECLATRAVQTSRLHPRSPCGCAVMGSSARLTHSHNTLWD